MSTSQDSTTRSTGPVASADGSGERRVGGGFGWWLGLALVAAGVRAIAWWRTAALFDDGPVFLALAQAMLDGDWSSALRHPYHPLYPAMVAALGGLGLGLESAGGLISILSGAAAVAAFALWLDSAFDRPTAWVGGALLALHPYAVSFSADVQSDGLYMAFFAWSALFLWRAPLSGRLLDYAAAGVLSGLAYLTRPEGLGVALLGGVAILGWAAAGARPWRRSAATLAVLAVAAAIPTGLYLSTVHGVTGSWQLTQKKSISRMAGLDGTSHSASAPATATSNPLAAPGVLPRAGDRPPPREVGERLAAAIWDFYRSSVSVFRFELLPFLAIGLFAARGLPGWRGIFSGGIALAYAAVLVSLVITSGYVSRRHALPPLLPLLGYASFGMALAASLAAGWINRRWPATETARGWVAIALVVAFLGIAWAPRDLAPRRIDRLAERRAAEWVRERALTPGPVAAGRPRVAYYAGRPYIPLPSGPPGGMLHYLRSHGVRYVIVDESKFDAHEGLREAERSGLRRIHREHEGGRTAAVFEVSEAPPPDDS